MHRLASFLTTIREPLLSNDESPSFDRRRRSWEVCAALEAMRAAAAAPPPPPPTARECMVCMDRPRAALLLPCHHSIVCAGCAAELLGRASSCPLCRTPIARFEEGDFGPDSFAGPRRMS